MAYPTIAAPYGLQPVNLIGGQPFAGSTRQLPIQYAYATNIFNGDFVVLSRGAITRAAVSTGTSANQITGVFVGCSFTNPTTKQKQFSQYWPGGTLAGDAVAYVVDDPDAVFKAVVCSSGTTVASGAFAMIGTNLSMIDNTGNTNTGNSANAVLAPTDTPATSILPVRCVGVVEETAVVLATSTYTSISTNTITIGTALTSALPVGTDVYSIAANGQMIRSGSFVDTAAAVGATTVVLNAPPSPAMVASPAATVVFVRYPEILVKANLLVHGYYSSTTA